MRASEPSPRATSAANLPFAPSIRVALHEAREAARQLRCSSVRAEHLLVGLLRSPRSRAVAHLQQLGVDPVHLEAQLLAHAGRGRQVPDLGELPFDRGAKAVLLGAARVALLAGQSRLQTDHLLLSVLRLSARRRFWVGTLELPLATRMLVEAILEAGGVLGGETELDDLASSPSGEPSGA